MWYIIPIAVVLDQLLKWWAYSAIAPFESVVLIPGVLSATNILNTGAFLGWFPNGNNILAIIAAAISSGVFIYLWLKGGHSKRVEIALVMIVSGAIGNLIDRLVHNGVVDFIQLEFMNFPVFNIADILITGGALLLAWHIITTDDHKKEKKEKNAKN